MYKCPKCGDSKFEEVMIDATVVSEIICVDENVLQYGVQLNEDGLVDRYQCVNCGEVVAKTQEEMIDLLRS